MADAAGIIYQKEKLNDTTFQKKMRTGIIQTKYFVIMSHADFRESGGETIFPLENDENTEGEDRYVILDGNHRMAVFSAL